MGPGTERKFGVGAHSGVGKMILLRIFSRILSQEHRNVHQFIFARCEKSIVQLNFPDLRARAHPMIYAKKKMRDPRK